MALINRLAAMEARIDALEAENAKLRERIAKVEQRKK